MDAPVNPVINIDCKRTCPICCDESVEDINARAEAALRNRALTLSSIVIVILLIAHIWFTYNGRVLPVPDIIWCIVLAPWMGAGGGKVMDLVAKLTVKK